MFWCCHDTHLHAWILYCTKWYSWCFSHKSNPFLQSLFVTVDVVMGIKKLYKRKLQRKERKLKLVLLPHSSYLFTHCRITYKLSKPRVDRINCTHICEYIVSACCQIWFAKNFSFTQYCKDMCTYRFSSFNYIQGTTVTGIDNDEWILTVSLKSQVWNPGATRVL